MQLKNKRLNTNKTGKLDQFKQLNFGLISLMKKKRGHVSNRFSMTSERGTLGRQP